MKGVSLGTNQCDLCREKANTVSNNAKNVLVKKKKNYLELCIYLLKKKFPCMCHGKTLSIFVRRN